MSPIKNTQSQDDVIKQTIVKPITALSKYNNCSYIGDRKKRLFMYKYMDIETAILCIKNNSIRFVEPTEWPDKYERRFYKADYSAVCNYKKFTPKLYACCFTFNKVSEAAWKTYSYNKSGLASRCVQFRINKKRFRDALDVYATSNKCKVYEGPMDYSYTDKNIAKLHMHDEKFHSILFNSDFSLNNYLSLMLIKRQAFNYENEYRFFIIPNNGKVKKHIYPIINWANIISEIKVDKQCSDIELELFSDVCRKAGINVNISKFDLYTCPDSQIKIVP